MIRLGNLAFAVPCLALVLLCGWRISSPGEPSELQQSTQSLIPTIGHQATGVDDIGPPVSAPGPSGEDGGSSGRAPLVRNLLRNRFKFHPRRPEPGAERRQISGGGKVTGAPVEYTSMLPTSLASFFDELDVKDRAIDAPHRRRGAARSPPHSAAQAAHGAGLPLHHKKRSSSAMRIGPASLNDYFDSLGAKGHAAMAKPKPKRKVHFPGKAPPVSLDSYFDALGGAQRGAATLIGGGPAGVRGKKDSHAGVRGRPAAARGRAKKVSSRSTHTSKAKKAKKVSISLDSYFDSLGGAQRGAATLIGGGPAGVRGKKYSHAGVRGRPAAVRRKAKKAKKAKLAKLSGAAARTAINRFPQLPKLTEVPLLLYTFLS